MKLRFLTSCSTDGPSFSAGRTYELEPALAAGFIRAGLAVPAEPQDKAPAPAVETANAEPPAVETANAEPPAVETANAAAPTRRRGRS